LFRYPIGEAQLLMECSENLREYADLAAVKIKSAADAGLQLKSGTKIQVGWSVLTLLPEPDGWRAWEPAFTKDALVDLNPDVNVTLRVLKDQAYVLGQVKEDGFDIRFDQMVIVLKGVLGLRRVFLKRVEPLNESDSGWFVGDPDHPDEQARDDLEATPVFELYRRRPALLRILALPPGYIVTTLEDGILNVFDGEGRDRWS